jgi:hypothetical protein
MSRSDGTPATRTPRLRHDKVAERVVAAVRSALDGDVPEGLCAVYAIAAPIREPRQTIRALVEMIRTRLRSGLERRGHADIICGNQIRLRIVAAGLPETARVLGFIIPIRHPTHCSTQSKRRSARTRRSGAAIAARRR